MKELSNDQIIKILGERFNEHRIASGLKDDDVIAGGGASRDALNKFRQNKGGITLLNFIKLLRGIDRLDALNELLPEIEQSPFESQKAAPKKRVRSIAKSDSNVIKWGDE